MRFWPLVRLKLPLTVRLLFLAAIYGQIVFAQQAATAQQHATAQRPAMNLCSASNDPATQTVSTDQGTITIGCPKIWISDRIFTVLDGLLRDVDSITLKSLEGLDPNSATSAELLSTVTDFETNLKYDQGAAVGNALKLQKANAERQADLKQFHTQEKINDAIWRRQELLQNRALSLQEQEYQLITKGKSQDDPEVKKVKLEEQVVSDQLSTLKSATTTPTISDQNISSSDTTQASQATASLTPLDQDALQKTFGNVLQSPKLPAAMQMDNVIDLLRQRLAREFGVMYDDLSRQSADYDLYLAEFDVGLLPGRHGKKQQPRITLAFTDNKALAYDLFPLGAAYNTVTGLAKTSRIGISGAAQTLFGFGLSAAFTHSRNQLRSSLSQNLYISAFGAGTPEFGWIFGSAPFEDFISAGTRSVYAILLVPKNIRTLALKIQSCWIKDGRSSSSDCASEKSEPTITFSLPRQNDPASPSQKLAALSYQPYADRTPVPGVTPANPPSVPTSNTVQLVFTEPIDPNMTITVGDKILRRVRDVRGRALYRTVSDGSTLAGNQSERDNLAKSRFGILEADTLGDDTWFQVNSTTVLLNISRQTAGTNTFPIIRISDPRSGGHDVFQMATDTTQSADPPAIHIGEWDFTPDTLQRAPSAFMPLFTEPYNPGRIKAYVDQLSPGSDYPTKIHLVSEKLQDQTKPVWLHELAQVVLETEGNNGPHWALQCYSDEGTLSCDMPASDAYINLAKNANEIFKVWIDQPPYYDRPGLWADTDIKRVSGSWTQDAYALANWSDVHEICSAGNCGPGLWDAWVAKIRVKNLTGKRYCVVGLPDSNTLRQREQNLKSENYALRAQSTKELETIRNLQSSSTQSPGIVNGAVGMVDNCPHAPVKVAPAGEYLSLEIPFDVFPYLTDSVTLERRDCQPSSEACKSITLPEIRSHLLPGPVVVSNLNRDYRLQGNHLKAVQKVRLVRAGELPHDFPDTVGINNVDFSVSPSVPAGSYDVFLLLNEIPVPAVYEDNDKKLQHLVLSVSPPKPVGKRPTGKKKIPNASPPGTNDKADSKSKSKPADTHK